MADEGTPREGGDYEFDAQQNKTLDGLATALKALAVERAKQSPSKTG